jgi:hypothetical protein
MGQTAQASGTESLSNGQTRPITAGWVSDVPAVATVTDAGLITGVGNGRATISVSAGGRQGQQVVRVVPDYQGQWSGALRVTSCTESGIFQQTDFCDEFPVGFTSGYTVGLAQTGESMTATASYGPMAVFPGIAAPVRDDGTSTFAPSLSISEQGITLTITAGFTINSPRIGSSPARLTKSGGCRTLLEKVVWFRASSRRPGPVRRRSRPEAMVTRASCGFFENLHAEAKAPVTLNRAYNG